MQIKDQPTSEVNSCTIVLIDKGKRCFCVYSLLIARQQLDYQPLLSPEHHVKNLPIDHKTPVRSCIS